MKPITLTYIFWQVISDIWVFLSVLLQMYKYTMLDPFPFIIREDQNVNLCGGQFTYPYGGYTFEVFPLLPKITGSKKQQGFSLMYDRGRKYAKSHANIKKQKHSTKDG